MRLWNLETGLTTQAFVAYEDEPRDRVDHEHEQAMADDHDQAHEAAARQHDVQYKRVLEYAACLGTRPNISESHSEISTRVPARTLANPMARSVLEYPVVLLGTGPVVGPRGHGEGVQLREVAAQQHVERQDGPGRTENICPRFAQSRVTLRYVLKQIINIAAT